MPKQRAEVLPAASEIGRARLDQQVCWTFSPMAKLTDIAQHCMMLDKVMNESQGCGHGEGLVGQALHAMWQTPIWSSRPLQHIIRVTAIVTSIIDSDTNIHIIIKCVQFGSKEGSSASSSVSKQLPPP
jgi:hypothetical protein